MISYLYEIKYALVHYGNVKYFRLTVCLRHAHKIHLIFQGAVSQVDESHLHDYAKLEKKRSWMNVLEQHITGKPTVGTY